MYNKILVTLDGSGLSEAVLPYVAEFFRSSGSQELVLLNVVEERGNRGLRRANSYLGGWASRLVEPPYQVPHVQWATIRTGAGGIAGTILGFAEENSLDLIVLSNHGRSGVDRWLMGSVAQKVLWGADIPVLLVPSSLGDAVSAPGLKRVLLPLDGSPLAERALPPVERLARFAGVEVCLLCVEPVSNGGSGREERASKDLPLHQGEDMAGYLGSIASNLADVGARVETRVRVGHPGQIIAKEAEIGPANLIVISSHGLTRAAGWSLGSIAGQVLRGSSVPVLLVRAGLEREIPQRAVGPLAHHCHRCGRRSRREDFSSQDRCSRCHTHLKVCGNCVQFDGHSCRLRPPVAGDAHPGNQCPQFAFLETPSKLT